MAFNWKIYRELNPDLKSANLDTENQLIDHWNKHGRREGRFHKVTDITPDFEWQQYSILNKDLEKNGITNYIDIELHWIKYGNKEQRNYKVKNITPDFEWWQYALLNPDLNNNSIFLKNDIEVHWLRHGLAEKRRYKLISSDIFVIKNYDRDFLCGYIMHSLYEEILNIYGINDAEFINQANLNDYFLNKYNRIPNAIVFLWRFTTNIHDKIRSQLPKTKIILWTDDLHWYNKETYNNNYYSYKNADIHLSRYNYYKLFYNLDIDSKLIKLHHSCGSHFYKNTINVNPINKIFIYGVVDTLHYKLRLWFVNKMSSRYPDKFVHKKHPGYNGNKFNVSVNTGNELYNYKISYTASCFPQFEIKEPSSPEYYLLGKFFEIPGSGALLLCNDFGVRKQLNELGFLNMKHYVHIDDTNFDEIINWLFNAENNAAIMEIRKNGHELVKMHHTTKKRMDIVNYQLIKKIS